MKKLIVGVGLLCFGSTLPAQNNGPQTLPELRVEIEKAMRATGTPGVAIAIITGGQVEWVVGLGLADVAAQRPVTTRTPFRLGSASKEFVALAALKLQENGKIKLTDSLAQWLPEVPIRNPWAATDPVRLEHLLEHTSGVPEMGLNEYAQSDPKPVSMTESLNFDPSNRYVRWRPGSRKAYSNYGIQLAAAMVEKAAGQRFEDYVREQLFLPLGMQHAGYFPEPGTAQSYGPGGHEVRPYSHLLYRAAGAVSASAEDLANYLRFHLERGSLDGRRILTPESMDRLEAPRTLPAVRRGVTTGYGLANGSAFTKGFEAHGHGGEVDGARALVGYIPELGVGRAILINADNPGAMGWIRSLVDGYIERGLAERPAPPPAALPAGLAKELAGYYANIAPRNDGFLGLAEYYGGVRRVELHDQGMTWLPVLGGPPERWVAMSDHLFRRPNATKPALAMVQGDSGGTWLQDDYVTLQRISPLWFWLVIGGLAASVGLLLSVVVFALFWGTRAVLGWRGATGTLAIRVCPLVTVAGLAGFAGCYARAGVGGYATLGTPNVWTVGMMLTSLLIPLGTLLSIAALWRHRGAETNPVVYWYSVAVALGLVFVTGFCLSWGMIGLRLWA